MAREDSKSLAKILLTPAFRESQISRGNQAWVAGVYSELQAAWKFEIGRQLGLIRFRTRWNGRPAQILLRLSLQHLAELGFRYLVAPNFRLRTSVSGRWLLITGRRWCGLIAGRCLTWRSILRLANLFIPIPCR